MMWLLRNFWQAVIPTVTEKYVIWIIANKRFLPCGLQQCVTGNPVGKIRLEARFHEKWMSPPFGRWCWFDSHLKNGKRLSYNNIKRRLDIKPIKTELWSDFISVNPIHFTENCELGDEHRCLLNAEFCDVRAQPFAGRKSNHSSTTSSCGEKHT